MDVTILVVQDAELAGEVEGSRQDTSPNRCPRMLALVVSTLCMLGASSPDTLDVPQLATAPAVDGRVDAREYGVPALHIPTAAGEVRVWIGQHGKFLYLAAILPDSTYYWGDDLVVSVDPNGDGGTSPGSDDRQWYLRRTLDSSVVIRATNGRWFAPGQRPTMLGMTRHDADWDVASISSPIGWVVELRIRSAIVRPGPTMPRLAVRTYNDQPSGWWSWPAPPAGLSAQGVEHNPALWVPLNMR